MWKIIDEYFEKNNNSFFLLSASDTDHHSEHVITGHGMIQKLVKMKRPEWIGQILLSSLLRYKTTFYKVQQENDSAIVSLVMAFSHSALHLQDKKRALFGRGMFDHQSHICYLLDICDRLSLHFSLGK